MKKQPVTSGIEKFPPEPMEYFGPEGYSPQYGAMKQGRIFSPGDLVREAFNDWVQRGILKPLEART